MSIIDAQEISNVANDSKTAVVDDGEAGSDFVGDSTFSITLGYNGRNFCGFAKQPGQRTVQGELEQALELLFRREVLTVCAGRTDSGVHARGQVVSFDLDEIELRGRALSSLQRSMHALTPDDIAVKDFCARPRGFSARFDAIVRRYRYFLSIDEVSPIFMDSFSWQVGALDVEAMRVASGHLIGEHDFKSFCVAASAIDKPTCRYIDKINLTEESIMGERMLVVEVVGNAFLHSMVRTIVGSLVAVGKSKRTSDWILEVLHARDRRAAGETAPAQGLVFWDVQY